MPTWVVRMQLLMTGKDQLCHQHHTLFKAQLIVLVCVQVFQDVINQLVISFLLLWVKIEEAVRAREENPDAQQAAR